MPLPEHRKWDQCSAGLEVFYINLQPVSEGGEMYLNLSRISFGRSKQPGRRLFRSKFGVAKPGEAPGEERRSELTPLVGVLLIAA